MENKNNLKKRSRRLPLQSSQYLVSIKTHLTTLPRLVLPSFLIFGVPRGWAEEKICGDSQIILVTLVPKVLFFKRQLDLLGFFCFSLKGFCFLSQKLLQFWVKFWGDFFTQNWRSETSSKRGGEKTVQLPWTERILTERTVASEKWCCVVGVKGQLWAHFAFRSHRKQTLVSFLA